jgi:AAA+ superfamily predicted ATPase
MTPAELYDFILDLAGRAERRGDWGRPGPIADEVQRHVMDVLFTIARADGDISRAESAFLAELLASASPSEQAQLREMVTGFGRAGPGSLRRVPHYFRILVAGDQMRGTVNAANVAACIRELGLHLLAADGQHLPQEVALLTEHVSVLQTAVAEAGVQQPRAEGASENALAGTEVLNPSAGQAQAHPSLQPQPAPTPPVQADEKEQVPPADLNELMAKLHRLVGMERVKKEVETLANLVRVRKMRQERRMTVPPMTLHMVFTGNPGTGKTTVARLLSEIFRALGVLSKGHLVETDRSGLVAGYVGQTAINVAEKVQAAMGGMLFIDEAYALASSDSGQDFGREAVDALVKLMEDNRADLIVVVAGYPEPMEKFLNSNPGLRSRFNRFLQFDDYAGPELFAILERMCEEHGYRLTPAAAEHARRVFQEMYDQRGANFANGRDVRNAFEKALARHANRVGPMTDVSDEVLCTLTRPDFGGGAEPAPEPVAETEPVPAAETDLERVAESAESAAAAMADTESASDAKAGAAGSAERPADAVRPVDPSA